MDIICYSYTIYRNVNMGIYGYNTIYKQFLWLIDEYIYIYMLTVAIYYINWFISRINGLRDNHYGREQWLLQSAI